MKGKEWDEPKQFDVGKIGKQKEKSEVAANDPTIKGMPICKTMWTGR